MLFEEKETRNCKSKLTNTCKWHNPNIASLEREHKWLGKMLRNYPHNNEHR